MPQCQFLDHLADVLPDEADRRYQIVILKDEGRTLSMPLPIDQFGDRSELIDARLRVTGIFPALRHGRAQILPSQPPARLLQQIEEDNTMDKLTPRQLQLLSSVAKGYSNADIAKQNNQSEIWIKKQLSAVFKSLGVANRSEAVALALSKQLLNV